MRHENNCVSVYVPDSLENNNVGFLPGFIQREGSQVKFYITDDKLKDVRIGCIGYCGLAHIEGLQERPTYWIRVSFSDGHFQVSHILCDGVQEYKLIYIFYDYNSFKKSKIISFSRQSKDDFYYLSTYLNNTKHHEKHVSNNMLYRGLDNVLTASCRICISLKKIVPPLTYSSTFQHIQEDIVQTRALLHEVACTNQFGLRVQNALFCRILELIIGLFILNRLIHHYEDGTRLVAYCVRSIVTNIAALLEFLMGSPVGLKLNRAFNQTLGHFFLYHISLWRAFLTAAAPTITYTGALACWLAAAGLSYQVALIADLFTLATFHVYCIYVYAARLYGIQMHGLVALWRLFLGRKRNPLKDRVDTYRYGSQQLFVGTLAFAVLLFLLPTTAMYYLVFLALRLAILVVAAVLERGRTIIRRFPLYVAMLWILDAAVVRGDVHVSVRPTHGALTVFATVNTGTWNACRQAVNPRQMQPESVPPKGSALIPTITFGNLI